jgi:hypothetical protein
MTVAIVDAYNLPSAEADLATYRAQYGLPPCTTANDCFHKVNQTGGSTPPATSAVGTGWDYEIALDIEMVSAICPNCHILLVEADTSSFSDLGPAVARAVTMGAKAVSNSYAGSEWNGEVAWDSYYNYYNHPGVAITASTGDCGWNCVGQFHGTNAPGVGYPAASPNVIAVGGTRLVKDGSARRWTESAWGNSYGGTGSGCSLYEPKPSWQPTGACGSFRTQSDVSAVADPDTGVAIALNNSWYIEGGTSASAPIIAAIYGLGGAPTAGSYPASHLYADPGDLNDVTSGNNDVTETTCPAGSLLCNGKVGYDGPTGLGTPNGIVAFTNATVPGKPAGPVAHRGDGSASLTWTAPSSGGLPITSYTVTSSPDGKQCATTGVTGCTVGGLTNGTPYTFTVHATNLVGDGLESDPSNTVVPAVPTAPAKPTGVTATGGAGSAVVVWTAPDDGGRPITGYSVTSAPDGKHCATTGSLTCTISGLTPGQTYTFTVIATNDIGPSDPSDQSAGVVVLSASTYHPMTPPFRLLDTRIGKALSGKFMANTSRTFTIAGVGAILAGASAITGNLTVVNSTSAGMVYLGPDSPSNPQASTMNFAKGVVTANGVTLGLSSTGSLSAIFIAASGNTTDLVLDVTGFFTPDVSGSTYHPLTPARILDTRKKIGMSAKLPANTPRSFPVWLRGKVPAKATAVTGNLTVVNSTNSYAVYLGPVGFAKPSTSTINFSKGQIMANNLTVGLSSTGTLSATFLSSNGYTTDLVFDVTGYYTADLTGDKFAPITPARFVDTRFGTGLTGKLPANSPRQFQLIGRGIPSGALAVSANTTVTNETAGYALFVGPDSIANPPTSTLNFEKGDIRANGLTVPLGAGGSLWVTYLAGAGKTTDFILDVTGYFTP